jgi:hypothetical protein
VSNKQTTPRTDARQLADATRHSSDALDNAYELSRELERQVRSPAKAINAYPTLVAALREIETICTEDNSACRKRMGTRVGNALVTAKAALKEIE